MPLTDELYRETILDHYHNPRNQGVIENPSAKVEGINPLCGDEITLYVNVDSGKIQDMKLHSRGCSINMASGSMMSEVVKGKSLEDATNTLNLFKKMMLGKEAVVLPEELEDLESLEGVKKYPVRIKCALLPWNALLEALKIAESGNPHAESKIVEDSSQYSTDNTAKI
jgi:nitrogen fixation protein NifU and related proteins